MAVGEDRRSNSLLVLDDIISQLSANPISPEVSACCAKVVIGPSVAPAPTDKEVKSSTGYSVFDTNDVVRPVRIGNAGRRQRIEFLIFAIVNTSPQVVYA